MKLFAKRLIFVAAICVGILCVGFMRWPVPIQTDLTSLVNLENGATFPIHTITNKFSSVINVVVQSSDRMAGEITAHKIRDIVNSDDFPELSIWVNDLSPREFVRVVGKRHNALLGVESRKLLVEHKYNDIANDAVQRIESSMLPKMLPLSEDPFLLFTDYVMEMGGGTNWVAQNGVLWQYRAPNNFYMLPIGIDAVDNSKLVEITTKLKSAMADVQSNDVKIYMGGAPMHTAEMYHRSKVEMGIISLLAILAVFVLNYLLFRRLMTIVPIGASLLVGYFFGTVALCLCFKMVHILTFVFGTSLIGLGIDYGFHFLCMPKGADRAVVHKSILHSLITTLICFAPLGFASIDLLRQISVFTIVGLVAIYLFIKWFVPMNTAYKSKQLKFIRPLNTKYRPFIICGIAVFAIVACVFARLENNMSAIYRPTGELLASEEIIADLNQSNGSAFLIVRGQNIQEVLGTEEAIRDTGVRFFGVSSIVPSLQRQAENNAMVAALYKAQAKSVKKALGLRKLPQFTPAPPITFEDADIGDLRDQVEKFLVESDGFVYSVSSVAADTMVTNENALVFVPASQIQAQMEKYSNETYRLLIICGIVLVIGLVVLYGWRAVKYLLPPVFGVGVSVALLTVLGMPITFFHMLGLFIVIGLGLDYAIFHINMKKDAELRPVFYSFLSSFIGFGLLAFTSFFLIAALGLILAIGIAVSYLVSLYLFRN